MLEQEREVLDLRTVVAATLDLVFPLLQAKEQVLELDLPEPLPAHADAAGLAEAMLAVLMSVHHAAPSGTCIAIRAHVAEAEVRLSVCATLPDIAAG